MGRVGCTSGDGLLKRIDDKLRSINPRDSTKFTIFRVPRTIRDIDPTAYKPQTISIGPYHHQHGKGSRHHLEKMEENKWVYFKGFLSRRSKSSTHSVAGYVRIARDCERESRRCYSEEISFGSDEFNFMMVLDACFLIELFLRGNMFVEEDGHAEEQKKDPIYSSATVDQGVCRDLLLLENQIPFFILTKIYDAYLGSSSGRSEESQLVNIASKYLIYPIKADQRPTQDLAPGNEICHLLHLVYLLHKPPTEGFCVPIDNARLNPGIQPVSLPPLKHTVVFPPAKSLHEAGIKFQRRNGANFPEISFENARLSPGIQPVSLPPLKPKVVFPPATSLHEAGIKFQRRNGVKFPEIIFENGVLKIPHLFIGWSTNSFFRNLVAFEQCLPRVQAYFTPYTAFMDYLINTPKDVEILCNNKIIRHELGCDEDVVSLFNEMGKGIVVGYYENYLSKAFMEVDQCRRRKIAKWLALLRHYYFRNPWLVVSFVAAVVLLFCTLIQSVCSVVQVI